MAKFRNISGGVISFSLGEKELKREFVIFPGEDAELPEGNSYIASIEAQKLVERVPADAPNADVATVGNTIVEPAKGKKNKSNTNLKQA